MTRFVPVLFFSYFYNFLYYTKKNKRIMRNFVIILLFVATSTNAQTLLKFDKRNVQCEDKWSESRQHIRLSIYLH
ncbi:MAG: hypothetical protein H6Q14_2856 [Bacteroidetes bacterium]|nr:hypothetical protein [Bacteroidota bacterium]